MGAARFDRSLLRYRSLLKHLVLKDLKLKYRSSVLGFLWSLANPLLLIAVYTFAFKVILRGGKENYPYFLLVGLLPWTFFAQSVIASATSVLDNGSLVKKIAFPLEVLPVATVAFHLIQYLLALAVFLPIGFFVMGVQPTWASLLFFPVLALHVTFTIGVSLLLAAGTVFFRDIRHMVEIAMMLLFWLTPVIYALADVPAAIRPLFLFNPPAVYTVLYHDVLFQQALPSGGLLAAAAVYAFAFFAAGRAVYGGLKPRFAEIV